MKGPPGKFGAFDARRGGRIICGLATVTAAIRGFWLHGVDQKAID